MPVVQHTALFTVIHRKCLDGLTVEPFLVYRFIFAFSKGPTSGSVIPNCVRPSARQPSESIMGMNVYGTRPTYWQITVRLAHFDTFISSCTIVVVCELIKRERSVLKVLYLTYLLK